MRGAQAGRQIPGKQEGAILCGLAKPYLTWPLDPGQRVWPRNQSINQWINKYINKVLKKRSKEMVPDNGGLMGRSWFGHEEFLLLRTSNPLDLTGVGITCREAPWTLKSAIHTLWLWQNILCFLGWNPLLPGACATHHHNFPHCPLFPTRAHLRYEHRVELCSLFFPNQILGNHNLLMLVPKSVRFISFHPNGL